jgi:hypothetical protein
MAAKPEVDDDRQQVGGDRRVGSTRPRVAGRGCGAAGHREDGGQQVRTAAGGQQVRTAAGGPREDGGRRTGKTAEMAGGQTLGGGAAPRPRGARGWESRERRPGRRRMGCGEIERIVFSCVTSGIGG